MEVATLFTDIEDSTRLWEEHGAQMARALAAHDRLAEAAVESHGGTVVKTTGDGIYAVFDDPLYAILAAVELQRALRDPAATEGLAIKVRCGIHAGAVEKRQSDYFGQTVNRGARIMSAAHGEQILLSAAVAGGIHTRIPAGLAIRDLGPVRLKGFASPEHVWQVVAAELRQSFPPLRSLEHTPHNLPQALTSFIGREQELAEATRLLRSGRLLTLAGMGGLGKTRLSLQIAAEVLDEFPDGAWVVDLVPVRDPALVARVAAQVLGLEEESGRPVLQTLEEHLRRRKLLLILDNCEHLVDACADLAHQLLAASASLTILATSREALHLPGEQVYTVPQMTVRTSMIDPKAIAASDAVQLFCDRARLADAGFLLTDERVPIVAELVGRLDGIPLAIELAAARMRTMSLIELNEGLRDRFRLLSSSRRGVETRQRTLQALVDWSYDLLSKAERIVLARASVFAGGFDLDAARAVCGVDPIDTDEVPEHVHSLVDKSLALADVREHGTRFRMLETIRDYAAGKLTARGEAPTAWSDHCLYFRRIASTANRALTGAQQGEWIRRLEADHDNMRVAMDRALSGVVDPVNAVKLQVSLQGFWILGGYSGEGLEYVRRALALPTIRESQIACGHALYVAGALAENQGLHAEAAGLLEECLALRRQFATPAVDIAATLSTLARARLSLGDVDRARAEECEALQLFRSLGDRVGEAIGLQHLADIAIVAQQPAEARANVEAALTIAREITHREVEGEAERTLGQLALDQGDIDEARTRFDRALAVARSAADKRNEAMATWWAGKADLEAHDFPEAALRFAAALHAFRSFDMYAELLDCLEDCAVLAHARGFLWQAVAVGSAASRARERRLLLRSAAQEGRWQQRLEALRQALGEDAFNDAWSRGCEMSLEAALREATAGTVEAPR